MHLVLGFLLALAIGIGCRWFAIPLPAPASLLGAFLILTATVGYVATDRYLAPDRAASQATKSDEERSALSRELPPVKSDQTSGSTDRK